MFKKLVSLTGLIIIAVIVLAVNLLGAMMLKGVKIDMTQERLYTLSQGSRNVIANLDVPVRGQLFYSKTAASAQPVLKDYAQRVIGLLREFEAASGGQFQVEIVEPRPFTEEEEWAQRYGLTPFSLEGIQENIYLGLVAKSEAGPEAALPVFTPANESTLEYDVIKLIYQVGQEEKPQVGVLSSLDVMGGPDASAMMGNQQSNRPWVFVEELQTQFEIRGLETDTTRIPDNLDLLLVIHPKEFSNQTRYAIDQYVMAGGKALVFVDAQCEIEQDQMGPQMNMQASMQATFHSEFDDLLQSWGLEMMSAESGGAFGGGPAPLVVADPKLAAKVRTQTGQVADMVVWLQLSDQETNDESIIAGQLDNLVMISPGGLRITDPEADDKEYNVILTTSDQATTIDAMMAKMFRQNPEQLARQAQDGSMQIPLAVKVTGQFQSAFADGPPEDDENEDADEPTTASEHLAESAEQATVIVVSDVDMIADRYSVQTMNLFGQTMTSLINDNLRLVNNAVDNLSGSADLIGLRSRGRSRRPLTRIQEIEQRAEARFRQEEEELNERLQNIRQELARLQQSEEGQEMLTAATMDKVQEFRAMQADTSEQLRKVQRERREEYERLVFNIKLLNIAVVPAVIALLGLVIGIGKFVRRRIKK